jgi:hypothetical protein
MHQPHGPGPATREGWCSVSEFFIVVQEAYQLDGQGDRWDNDHPARRPVAIDSDERVAAVLCEALAHAFAGASYAEPCFTSVPACGLPPPTYANWKLQVQKLDDRLGRADDESERARLAAYHHRAVELEAIIRVQVGIPAETSTPAQPAGGGGTSTEGPSGAAPQGNDAAIPARARKAYEQYRQAAEALGDPNPTDRQAYDQLVRACEQSDEADELPTSDAWQRNLREYRERTGTQKHKSRRERAQPRASCTRPDQLNVNELPTSIRPKDADS